MNKNDECGSELLANNTPFSVSQFLSRKMAFLTNRFGKEIVDYD